MDIEYMMTVSQNPYIIRRQALYEIYRGKIVQILLSNGGEKKKKRKLS